jgi:DNA-binding NtrC family response regulator
MLEVLLADGDENVRQSVAGALIDSGHHVTEASDGAEAARLLDTHVFDLAICDLRMPHVDGLTLLRRIRRKAPRTAVILMTRYGRAPQVIGNLHDGGVDYILKPFDPESLARRYVDPIVAARALHDRFRGARPGRKAKATEPSLIAASPAMCHTVERMGLLATTDVPLLVTGDRGTGKKLVARAIHEAGSRREGPLVILDGALLPEVIFASEWGGLGDEDPPHDAWFREAEGGTLVLDGIERLSRTAQAHLLRVLDEHAAPAHGTAEWEPRGVRLVTLSRAALVDRVVAGEFLESLYYRLDGAEVHLPRLAERREDLHPLVTALFDEIRPASPAARILSPAAWAALEAYPFPGNVTELRLMLEHAFALAEGGTIDVGHLPAAITGANRLTIAPATLPASCRSTAGTPGGTRWAPRIPAGTPPRTAAGSGRGRSPAPARRGSRRAARGTRCRPPRAGAAASARWSPGAARSRPAPGRLSAARRR